MSKAIQAVQFRPFILNSSLSESSSVMHTGLDIPYQISQEKDARIKFPCNTLRNKSRDRSGMENGNEVGFKSRQTLDNVIFFSKIKSLFSMYRYNASWNYLGIRVRWLLLCKCLGKSIMSVSYELTAGMVSRNLIIFWCPWWIQNENITGLRVC